MAPPVSDGGLHLSYEGQKFKETSVIENFLKKYEEKAVKLALERADKYYLYEWFTRISWKKKEQFIKRILRSIDDIVALNKLILSLDKITKDLIYAKVNINTKSSFDIIPNDHDRTLDETVLQEVMKFDEEWLLTSVDCTERCCILLDLIRMSGSAIAAKVLSEAKTLVQTFQFIDYLKNLFIKEKVEEESILIESEDNIDNILENESINKFILNEIANNENIQSLFDLYEFCSSISPNLQHITYMKKLLIDVKTNENLWETHLKRLLEIAHGKFKDKAGYLINESVLEIDRLQLLPLKANRRILKYLDKTSKRALSKVDKFWYESVKAEAKEEQARQNLNNELGKIEKKLLNINIPGHVYKAKNMIKNKTKSDDEQKPKLKLYRDKSFSSMENCIQEPIFSLVKRFPMNRNPFIFKYSRFNIVTPSMYDRIIDCSNRWIACTENTSVVFYNLITGVKSHFILDQHSLVITCLKFFPDSNRIATAGLDKTIKTWDLWHIKLLHTFTGHKDVILSISVYEDYIVSCARDETIRVVSLKSHKVLLIVKQRKFSPTMVLAANSKQFYVVTSNGTLKMLSIYDSNINKEIKQAHSGYITFINKCGPLIVTSGEDLFVRIWNENLEKENCLVEIYHEKNVNSAVICQSTLITGCIDGYVRFWDLGTRKLFRKILINNNFSPIISIHVKSYYNHIKILCNCESSIYILQFILKSVKRSVKANPYQALLIHSGPRISPKTRRLLRLNANKCSLLPPLYKNTNITTDSILLNAVNDKRLIKQFPRYTREPLSEYEQLQTNLRLNRKVDGTYNKKSLLTFALTRSR